MFLFVISVVALLAILFIAGPGGIAIAPWVSSRTSDIERIIQRIDLKPGENFVDLGAGDAKILAGVLANAEKNKHRPRPSINGVEISLMAYFLGRVKLFFIAEKARINFRLMSFFKYPLATADVIYCFLTPEAMKRVKPWLEMNVRPGARLISYVFPVPGWTAALIDKPSKNQLPIYVYHR